MRSSQKINLAVIFSGVRAQKGANDRQFSDLKRPLRSFRLWMYGPREFSRLLRDYRAGRVQAVLKNAYGRRNEIDWEIFLEKNRIPFFGSGSQATRQGTDKNLAKIKFRQAGLTVAGSITVDVKKWRLFSKKILLDINNKIKYPCLIKDVTGTDSRGIYFIENKQKLLNILPRVLKKHQVIIEEFISPAQEVTCLVVGNHKPRAYEPVEIIKNNNFLSANDKDRGSLKLKIPARLPARTIVKIKQLAVNAHRALNCRTFSRADIIIRGSKAYLIEVDVHPGFRLSSPTLLSAKFNGQSPDDLFLKFYRLIL